MSREKWNKQFVAELMKISNAKQKTCELEAQESTSYFEEGYEPAHAAAEAYSYWDS